MPTDFDVDADVEIILLHALLRSESFARKIMPHVSPEYFSGVESDIVDIVKGYFLQHRKLPKMSVIVSEIKERFKDDSKRSEKFKKAKVCLKKAKNVDFDMDKPDEYAWIYEKTKHFLKKESLLRAIINSAERVEETKHLTDGTFNAILQDVRQAIGMSFDEDMGLDYFEDIQDRYRRMLKNEKIFPTGFPELDREMGGGWHSGSVSIVMGSTGMGKSMLLENFTVNLIRQGFDVVYLTLELGEDEIAKRIDGKFVNIKVNNLLKKIKKAYKRLKKLRKDDDLGKLIIKEFPPSYTVSQFENYLEELDIKRGVNPDILVVDYLGEMSPEDRGDNSYQDLKFVTRELRSLAARKDYPVLSAAQVNRKGYDSPADLKHTSDSIGIPQVIDFSMVIWQDDTMKAAHEIEAIIRKNRFGKNGSRFKFHVDYDFLRVKSEEQMQDEPDNIENDGDLIQKTADKLDNWRDETKENEQK